MTVDVPKLNPLYAYLGLSPESIDIQSYLGTNSAPTISTVQQYTYHAYKSEGISLGFIKGSDNSLILDSIDIYNAQTHDGFQPFIRPQDLPCDLKRDMQGHEIVALLGEPDRKGGGGRTRTPCWIEYLFKTDNKRESGMVIQLHGVEWEDREMGWTSLVLY
ncbi:hypothetical protein CU097_014564 [Rhizopus azygosporus]|uniref:Uncharacterized protein n=1 Tax=Rhizopus azygosporus TaxID=86630 RepID=A0A367K2A4_RHIAZ|nr:hypothetical protein CU097_014564 [Rhizopus azygosporus]